MGTLRKNKTSETVSHNYPFKRLGQSMSSSIYRKIEKKKIIGRKKDKAESVYVILFHMPDTFYLSSFFASISLINYASSYRKM